jgi:NAD(P)H-flavin reductase
MLHYKLMASKAHLVFACGPKEMVNHCWDAANIKKSKGNRFDFHHETFNW